MSIIDDSNKSLKNRPFDELSAKESLKTSNVRFEAVTEERPANYLSTRASIFAACVMVSVCILVPYNYTGVLELLKSLGLVIGGIIVYCLLWSFTFRFFEKPSLMPLNIMLNVLPVAAIAYIMKSVNAFESFSVLAAGVTCLTLMSDDVPANNGLTKKGFSVVELFDGEFISSPEFISASIVNEVLLPLVTGVFSAACGVLFTSFISRYGAMQNAGIRLMVTSIFVMLLSFVISKIRGKDFYVSSMKISDNYDLPSVDFPALRSFVLRRVRFLLSLTIICFGCYISDYLCQISNLNIPYIKYAVSLVLILSFAFIRGRHTKHKAQYAVELCLCYAIGIGRCFSFKATLISIFAGVLVDLLVTGMFFTYKRSLVHSKRSKYVEGMPLMLLSVSLLLIVCAAVLDYWGVML
ncbi:MAG: hypothetical protein MJ094_06210 [Saccharofermentans sp.]|nr:hypothetical protein [Saccharofermentans sp.]